MIILWQHCLCKHAANVELEIDNWAVDIMGYEYLENYSKTETGAITMYMIVINHMVLCNQETIDVL